MERSRFCSFNYNDEGQSRELLNSIFVIYCSDEILRFLAKLGNEINAECTDIDEIKYIIPAILINGAN